MRSSYHGSENISYLGPKIWEIVSTKIKETNSLDNFKIEIKIEIDDKVVLADFANNILVVLVFLQ